MFRQGFAIALVGIGLYKRHKYLAAYGGDKYGRAEQVPLVGGSSFLSSPVFQYGGRNGRGGGGRGAASPLPNAAANATHKGHVQYAAIGTDGAAAADSPATVRDHHRPASSASSAAARPFVPLPVFSAARAPPTPKTPT